jgi:hypothetical protein
MAKLKKQATPAPDPGSTRDKTTATPRPEGISRVSATNKHGKNHRLTLKQRNVVRNLMAPNKLNMTASQASTIFNYIFRNRSLTAKELREDWATRNNRKGGNMYIDRILKHAGNFTREEIVASGEAVAQIRNACDNLEIELPGNVEMDEDMGDPTDATVLHPTAPLSRLPRGVIDGDRIVLGYQPKPEGWVRATTLWEEDDRSIRRRVKMCGEGVHTRRQVNQYVPRTPSVEPRVVGNTFLPVAPGDSDDSDLEGQAEMRRIQRAQSAPAEQQRCAQEQQRRDQARQNRASVPRALAEQARSGFMSRIEEEDEDEEEDDEDNAGGESDDDSGQEDEDNNGGFNAVDAEQDESNDHQFNLADLLENEETPINNTRHSRSGEMGVVDNTLRKMSDQFRAVSVSETNTSVRALAAAQAQQIKEDHYALPVLEVLITLSLAKPIEVFRAAFPTLKDHEVGKFNFRSCEDIQAVWHLHRGHPKMFDLDDALKSTYSPILPSYVPRLRMYHRAVVYHLRNGNGFNRPPTFGEIPPTEEIYKYGGPIIRVAVPENAAIEEIMICNNAFCSMCSFFQGSPATGDPDYNLHNLPFIHARYINAENMSIVAPGSLTTLTSSLVA